MEWLLLLFFLPFIVTLMFFNWLEEKFYSFRDVEKLAEGETLLSEKKYLEAQIFFTEKLKLFPKSSKAYYFRGKVNLALENYFSALYDIEQSISFDHIYFAFFAFFWFFLYFILFYFFLFDFVLFILF